MTMDIRPANSTKNLGSLRADMMAARQAVAQRETPSEKFRGYDVLWATDKVLDVVDRSTPSLDWTPETDLSKAVRDLRMTRKAYYKEAAWRGAAAFGGAALVCEASRLLSGAAAFSSGAIEMSTSATIACGLGVLAVGLLARPDKAIAYYSAANELGRVANTMEAWS